jgi:hypothetical protein
LAGAEKLPWTAQPQVDFGNLETVSRLHHGLKPLLRQLVSRRGRNQKAV